MLLMAGKMGQVSLACDIAAILSERDILRGDGRSRSAEIRIRLSLLEMWRAQGAEAVVGEDGDPALCRRVDQAASQWRKRLPGTDRPRNPEVTGDLLVYAYPDRLARRRADERERYLLATGRAHPALAARLADLAQITATHQRVLVHGDFSPKNLLIGPDGPVVLDAECAWFGDPAFDLAFVLNHLLLKGVWKRHWRSGYLHLFERLVGAYRAHVGWEPWQALDARTAALLPGLLLGRVDGKSPVEYVTADADKDAIRAFARGLLTRPVAGVLAIAHQWGRTS